MSCSEESEMDPLPGLRFDWMESPLESGSFVDGYEIVSQIGRGGMGTVYLATQHSPFQRDVAIKVIKRGQESRRTLSRFHTERQTLARMKHQYVAQIYGGGVTEKGFPYFVMELVDGMPIVRFCDQQRMTVKQRLRLFLKVCDGVNHAHQKGVIHRDLKPSNILVSEDSGKNIPKIIDFGLAKSFDRGTQDVQDEQTALTELGHILGTFRYMSPEHATLGSADVDTRSDVYSLGVVLFELLVGSPPLEFSTETDGGLLETLEAIRSREVVRASEKIGNSQDREEIAARRQMTASELGRTLRGDLDLIISKALRIDRTKRYASVAELAADIERFLNHEPISARPLSFYYQTSRLFQRNRLAFILSSTLALLMIVATIGSSMLAFWANTERKVAREAEARSAASRQRAVAALSSIQEFVLDSPVWTTANPARDDLIDVLAREYEFWALTDAASDEDVFQLLASLTRLAPQKSKTGRYDDARSLIEAGQKIAMSKLPSDSMEQQLAMLELRSLGIVIGIEKADEAPIAELAQLALELDGLSRVAQTSQQHAAVCRVGQLLVRGYYTNQSKETYTKACENLALCELATGKYPNDGSIKLHLARAHDLKALSLHKGYAQEEQRTRRMAPILDTYDSAVKIVEELIDVGYRPDKCKQRLIGIRSNKGMSLLNAVRDGIREPHDVIDNYDKAIETCTGLLHQYPDNIEFKELMGLLFLNKADTHRIFSDWQAESDVRKRSRSLLKSVMNQVSTESTAARRYWHNQSRYVLCKIRLGEIELAKKMAAEFVENQTDWTDVNALSTLAVCAMILECHPPAEYHATIIERANREFEKLRHNQGLTAEFNEIIAGGYRFETLSVVPGYAEYLAEHFPGG